MAKIIVEGRRISWQNAAAIRWWRRLASAGFGGRLLKLWRRVLLILATRQVAGGTRIVRDREAAAGPFGSFR